MMVPLLYKVPSVLPSSKYVLTSTMAFGSRMCLSNRFQQVKRISRRVKELRDQAIHREANRAFELLCYAYDNGQVCRTDFDCWKETVMHSAEKKKSLLQYRL